MKNLIIVPVFAFLLNSCNGVTGNGNVIEEDRTVPDFTGIVASGSIDVEVNPGNEIHVKVVNDENLISYVVTEVKNGELRIYYEKNSNISSDHAKVIVTSPEVRLLQTSGSGDISTNGTITGGQAIELKSSGSGDVTATVDVPAVTITGSGSGDFKISGRTIDLNCQVTGSGNVDTKELRAEKVSLKGSGSSDFKVFAKESLKANLSGSGDVLYWGNPALSDIRATGSGKLKAGK